MAGQCRRTLLPSVTGSEHSSHVFAMSHHKGLAGCSCLSTVILICAYFSFRPLSPSPLSSSRACVRQEPALATGNNSLALVSITDREARASGRPRPTAFGEGGRCASVSRFAVNLRGLPGYKTASAERSRG